MRDCSRVTHHASSRIHDADTLILRLATVDDIPALVSHRRRMFEDMYAQKDVVRDRAAYDAMDTAYADILRYEIPAGSTRAWVIDDGGTIAASGALKFTDWLPRPDGQRRGLVYVHSVYYDAGISPAGTGAAHLASDDRLLPRKWLAAHQPACQRHGARTL